MSKKCSPTLVLSVLVLGLTTAAAAPASQDQIDKAKSSRNTYAVITETDLYCAFFVVDKEPLTRILAPAIGERLLLSDADQFYGGPVGEWREGQIFQIVEIGPSVPGVRGNIGFGRGRAKIVRVESERFLAQIEKSCGPVHIGDRLVPFEKKSPVVGRDLGYQGIPKGGNVLTSRIIFMSDDHQEIGADSYALIDRGLEAGLRPGQQMTVFDASSGGKSPQAVGNAVVIDAGRLTATIKIMSLKNIIQMGDLVQVK